MIKMYVFTHEILGMESWTVEVADHFYKIGCYNWGLSESDGKCFITHIAAAECQDKAYTNVHTCLERMLKDTKLTATLNSSKVLYESNPHGVLEE